jgi:hypothetical protein
MQTDDITRTTALAQLDLLIGTWSVEAHFPGVPPSGVGGRTTFERALDGAFVVERSEVEHPDAPDGLAIIAFDPDTGAYRQHYFDSRGVVRLYAMQFRDRVWTLLRDSADFTTLEFSQRFAGTFSEDGNRIDGRWEIAHDHATWELDFELTYRRLDAPGTGAVAG